MTGPFRNAGLVNLDVLAATSARSAIVLHVKAAAAYIPNSRIFDVTNSSSDLSNKVFKVRLTLLR